MDSVAAAAASLAAPPPQPQVTGAVAPAQLGFLAIFNPSLGNTDETIDDQIVYYTSVTHNDSPRKKRRSRGRPTADISQEERHERLRQIGLAQGMASFSKDFADGATVDAIDTDKTRVVLHELEPGWWILASIDLTKIPLPPRLPTKTGEHPDERFEYSTKEMKPASLILRDLLRAHSLFLMHHDSSLSALFVRSKRTKFVAVLSRYWDLFLSTWNVMLQGNPIRAVLGGINIAGSGELGIGVGEEERGSGEREVLEGLVGRIEGLVDLVVSKFGDEEVSASEDGAQTDQTPWLGTGQEPASEDGAIFLGTGALSRKSLRDVTHWMEDLYTWGEHAYGVIDSPTSTRRQHKRKASKHQASNPDGARASDDANGAPTGSKVVDDETSKPQDDDDGKLDKMVHYLKLGYGTYWSLPGGASDSSGQGPSEQASSSKVQTSETADPEPQQDVGKDFGLQRLSGIRRASSHDSTAHYLIGLRGDIEEGNSDHETERESDDPDTSNNSRTVVRTINVELEREAEGRPEATIVRDFEHPGSILTQSQVVGNMLPGYDSHDLNKAVKLRVVVYVNRPFIYAFFFKLRTDSLAWDALYRSLHYQLAPLRKQLLVSTRYRPERPAAGPVASSIYDLIWDPKNLTVHSTIPNIPEQYAPQDSWSRADALSTHLHLLNLHGATRSKGTDLERTQKTNRGWWVVWTRLMEKSAGDMSASLSTIKETESEDERTYSRAGTAEEEDQGPQVDKEIFLIRRASDHARFRSEGGNDGAGKLAQGIGVDTRRYVEELLSLL